MRFFALLIVALLLPSIAFAASVVVEIKPIKPEGLPQKVICDDFKQCFAAIIFADDKDLKAPLIGRLSYVPGNLAIRFQSPEGYLYIGDNKSASDTSWHVPLGVDNTATASLMLFLPAVPAASIDSISHSPILNVTYKKIAELKISIAPVVSLIPEPDHTHSYNYLPPNGVIPDSNTAIEVAKVVYPALRSELPLKAHLGGNVWYVEGSMPTAPPGTEMVGGVGEIEISKTDGKVFRMHHGE